MDQIIRINQADNAAVALQAIPAGSRIECPWAETVQSLTVTEDIPAGHKLALYDIPAGTPVIKYGSPIGYAQTLIPVGGWIHTHNLKTGLGEQLEYEYHPAASAAMETEDAYFEGYIRRDGKAGVRNEIWVIPTVGCVNNVAQAIAERTRRWYEATFPDDVGRVDAIAAFPHPYGCSQLGEDQEGTRQILADLIRHPNAAGVLVLGLGCENSSIGELKKYIGAYDPDQVRFLVCQESEDEMADGQSMLQELVGKAREDRRQKISAQELVIGLKCGGSDGFSGITANPLVGRFSDRIIGAGGTAILTEVPEMFGAETLLMNRCADEGLFQKTVDLINDFKGYFQKYDQPVYENPSPGNKQGGISTLEDKSLGCTQKSGSAPVKGVLAYGETVKAKGLNLLCAPGNDLCAATALAAAGAQIVLFTTGRGTPFAAPVPTVKISSNTPLADRKAAWIDFNAGKLLDMTFMDSLSEELFAYVLEVASGRKVKSEEAGFHDMAVWKKGVTL